MTLPNYPPEFLEQLQKVRGKRARIVVEHILQFGLITTEDLETTYGYSHPPRAIRDVREQGIPIESFSVTNTVGRKIAAYRFGDIKAPVRLQFSGRRSFPKGVKNKLYALQSGRCAVCNTEHQMRYLQIDHRIPYLVAGNPDTDRLDTTDYMLVCPSCNRAKSWSCEHCENGQQIQNPGLCLTCYWANPLQYQHIALNPIRRVELTWTGKETRTYDALAEKADETSQSLHEFIKSILVKHMDEDS